MSKISILLVDDHQLFRFGICQILRKIDDFEILGEADSTEKAYTLCSSLNPDIVLMDIAFPKDDSGVSMAAQIKKSFRTKILALTSHNEDRYVVDMLRAGASGYLVKNASPDELVRAIRAIYSGHSYFSQNISKTIFQNSEKERKLNSKLKDFSITSRELEILKYVSDEMTNKEIANELFISPRTVETHKRNLMQKLKVKNVVGLAKFYFKISYQPDNEYHAA